jgi:hypothetical protein
MELESLHYAKNPFLKFFFGKLFSGIEFWTCQKYVQGRNVEGTFSKNFFIGFLENPKKMIKKVVFLAFFDDFL